jgi:hypothetical protein
MILQHLGLKEVHYVEKHTGEKFKAELVSPPAKEAGAEEAKPAEDAKSDSTPA